MKKTLAIILAILMIVSVSLVATGCNSNTIKQALSGKEPSSIEDEANENGIVGGWTRAESPEITDEFLKVFEKATNELTGMDYEPVAYIASQVVAGTNHLVLCKATVVIPDAEPKYSLVYIYEDLSGNAEITEMIDSDIPAIVSKDLDGGWYESESLAVTDEIKAAFKKANETLTGAQYTPVAVLGSQVAAGTNYAILCEMTATVPNAETQYAIVYIYCDLQGNSEITDSVTFESREDDEQPQEVEEQTDTSKSDNN
jgi:hypothetical protein